LNQEKNPMIDLYFWPTGNGKKIVILLEELGLPYTIKPINIGRGDQLTPEFLKISPNGRMPAIVDDEPMGGDAPISIFESGPIMMYLAEKSGRFYPQDPHSKYDVAQWVGWQLANQGPKLGEQGHFRRAAESGNNGDLTYALRRFDNETHRIFGVMNLGLFNKRYLAAGQYTIADMICYPWASSWATRKIDIDEFPNVKRWLEEIGERPAVKKAMAWGQSSGRIRLRSAPRSRPVAENWLQTSGRNRSRRSGSVLHSAVGKSARSPERPSPSAGEGANSQQAND
jgi:GSH-dependent disulfide-bond oxidoreductase